MSVKQLDHLNLSVRDFDETVDWYRRVFGFELVEEGIQENWGGAADVRWGVVRSGDAMLCIYAHPELQRPTPDDMRADHHLHTIAHFGLRITDRPAWEETVQRERLAIMYGGPIQWPHSTAWYLHDPTGYEIEVALWEHDEVAFGN